MTKQLTDQQLKNQTLVRQVIDNGWAISSQVNDKEGHVTYQILGGAYDGVSFRMYPPFDERYTLLGEVYAVGGPKDKRTGRMTLRRISD